MSDDPTTNERLIPARRAELTRPETTSLVARSLSDLQKTDLRKQEAKEWLRRGLELQEIARNDPEWCSIQEFPFIDEQPGPEFVTEGFLAKLIKGSEYVRQVLAGGEPKQVAGQLEMSEEDQELAHIAHFFMPSMLAEFRLFEDDTSFADGSSSVPTPAGLKNGIPSRAMVERMGRLKRGGVQAYAENKRLRSIRQRHKEELEEAFRCFERGLEVDPVNPALMYHLALSHFLGDGVLKDEERALAFFQRAADMGNAEAQHAVAFCKSSSTPSPTE